MKNNWNRYIATYCLFGISASAFCQGVITGLTAEPKGVGEIVHVLGHGLKITNAKSMFNGYAFVAHFNGHFETHVHKIDIRNGDVWFAKITPYEHHSGAQVYISKMSGTKGTVVPTSNGYDIYIHVLPGTSNTAVVQSIGEKTTTLLPKQAEIKSNSAIAELMALAHEKAAKSTPLTLIPTSDLNPKSPVAIVTKALSNFKPATTVPTKPRSLTPPGKSLQEVLFATAKAEHLDESFDPIKSNESSTKAKDLGPIVSLDFVNTDVVQILKALALQSGVNIMTSPAVQGSKITVSMEKVHVKDALDYITSLAGLKYAKIQNNYVVTGKDEYNSIMANLANQSQRQNIIRVVPIISGDGSDIKDALFRWFGPSTLQVMLPGEVPAGSGAVASQGSNPNPKSGAPSSTGSSADQNSPYLMLIGQKHWVNQAQDMVKKLDADIMSARNEGEAEQENEDQIRKSEKETLEAAIAKAHKSDQKIMSYSVMNGKADDLVKQVQGIKDFQALDFIASPQGSPRQVVIIKGKDSLALEAEKMLQDLDGTAQTASDVYVYNVRFADPRALREDLTIAIPGLTALIPPASVGSPEEYQPGSEYNQLNQSQRMSQQASQGASPTQNSSQSSTSSTSMNPNSTSGGGTGGQSPDSSATTSLLSQGYSTLLSLQSQSVPMRLILRGTKGQIHEALSYLHKIDIAPKQIALELRVMELSKDQAMKLGINWSLLTGGAVKTINLNESQGGIGTNAGPANSIAGNIGGRKWGGSVTATLDAIANKTNLIARPNLLAIDGRVGALFVGDDIKYIESIQSSQNGVSVQTGDVPVGVTLDVLPHIGGGGNITMELMPVVSFLNSFTNVPGGGQLPQTSQRAALSTIEMHSGETLAIGGLIQDQDIKNIQKVPILGDIPILGQLFRSTTMDRQRTEVVFFLTVREVNRHNRDDAARPKGDGHIVDRELKQVNSAK